MMMSEFIDRTGFEPTAKEYAKIEDAYYNFDGDKDASSASYWMWELDSTQRKVWRKSRKRSGLPFRSWRTAWLILTGSRTSTMRCCPANAPISAI